MRLARLIALLAIAFTFASSAYSASFTKKTYPHGNVPISVVSADINRDGNPDVIGAYRTLNTGADHGFLDVLMGWQGSFASGQTFSTTSDPGQIVAGDFNNDGYPDIVALEDDGIQVFLSAKNGALLPQAEVKFGCAGCVGEDIVAVDLNGDHIPDIAYVVCSNPSGCALHTELNNGSGVLSSATGQSTGLDPYVINHSLVAADFNRDGIDDFAVASGNTVKVFKSTGGGAFTLMQTITKTTPTGELAAGDIDAKNGSDLVFSSSPSCFPDCIQAENIFVYLNDGTGKLTQKQSFHPNSAATNALALVDITGDNRLDLIAINGELQMNNGNLSWAHYSGSGTFGSWATLLQMGDPVDLVGRDFNFDSKHDLAVADAYGDFATPGTIILTNTTSGAAICTPPSTANLAANLCSPSSNPGSRTFTVKAAGNSPTGVRRVELWIDGVKKYNSPDDRLKTSVTVSSGSHKLEIVAVDQFGKTAKLAKTITVP